MTSKRLLVSTFVLSLSLSGVALIVTPPSVFASAYQRTQKRLILKSGDYQETDEWKVIGDRVRYHSTERNEWEDIPNALIDWDATNKYNAGNPTTRNKSDELKKADEEYQAALREEEAKNPPVAPGIHLPDDGGVYLLDTYADKPELVEINQSSGNLNKQMGKNVLHAVINPIPTGAKQTIELPGRHARIEAHIPQPSLYVNVDEGTGGPPPLPPDQRWKIIRIDQTKDGRVISKVKINLLGKSSESQNVIPATVQKLSTSDWVKITPSQPLALGQYALVEMISRDEINMNVWDFGINPSGPENPATGDQPKKNPLDNGYTKLGDDDTEQQPTKQKKPKN